VILITGQFEQLAKAVMRSRNVPDRAAVIIPGNPESVGDDALVSIAEYVLEQSVSRLTGR
jgi:hypothetical protein